MYTKDDFDKKTKPHRCYVNTEQDRVLYQLKRHYRTSMSNALLIAASNELLRIEREADSAKVEPKLNPMVWR